MGTAFDGAARRPRRGEDALDGVAAGDVIGDRYQLRRRLEVRFEAERWLAHDDTLARPVEICVLHVGHPRAEAVLDAARQASGVADQRLVRVLDVGAEQGCTYVVTEWVDGDTLTELVRHGPLAADQARAVIGETALALEQGRRRGLHHLLLSSDNVLRLDDGSVKVAGLAVDAALAGLEPDGPDDASRQDTFGLIAVAYSALTGFWPTSSGYAHSYELAESTLPQAPEVAGSPAAPAQIVSGVPADLDTLCVQAFTGRGAPDTPGDLAGQIAPWGDQVRADRPTGAFPLTLPPTRHTSTDQHAQRPGTAEHEPSHPTGSSVSSESTDSTGSSESSGSLPHAPEPTPASPASTVRTPAPRLPVAPPPTPSGPPVHSPAHPATPPPSPPPSPPDPPATSALPTPGAADPDDALAWGGLFDEARERPAPLLPQASLARPPRTQTRTVLIVVGAFVLVMLALAKCGLSGLGPSGFDAGPGSSPSPSSSTPATTTPTGSATTPADTDTDTAGEPVRIAAVSSFDPQGDGEEKESLAANAIDGDADTEWMSDAYKTSAFSGLKKGVGLRLDLGRDVTVHEVEVTVPTAGTDLELRTMSGTRLSGTTVVARADDLDGTVTLRPSTAVTTRYLLLWFTKATEDRDGYRVAVSTVTVS